MSEGWGFDGYAAGGLELTGDEPGRLARVLGQYQGIYELGTPATRLLGRPSNKLRRLKHEPFSFPLVGDWVVIRHSGQGEAVIDRILPRRTLLVRKAAAEERPQGIAANLDGVFVVTSLDADLNVRRLERYLSAVHESGAKPSFVLTKSDLPADAEGVAKALAGLPADVPRYPLSSATGDGVAAFEASMLSGKTYALIGSSGVGKSTLLNRLLGEARMHTQPLGQDGRGVHTTTNRSLHVLPSGAMVIDSPGMRELGLWEADAGVAATFTDIEELALTCRFNDCKHEQEPGCAVLAAVAAGTLVGARFEAYRKLHSELAQKSALALQAEMRQKRQSTRPRPPPPPGRR
jgi:ribosome biogenesis GTPase